MEKSIKNFQSVHLMGICGTAMASLAGLLKDQGYQVTGSDENVYPPMSTQLEKLGIPIMEGYRRDNLSHNPDLVIVGNVISKHFPEAMEMMEKGLSYTSLPKAIGEWVIGHRNSVVIAGTHGKTTTTALMTWLAESCQLHPGFLIGGIPKNFSQSFRNPGSKNNSEEWFIIEGDEYDTAFFDKVPKFVHYRPKFVILTSIEFDHADIYRDLDHVMESFRQLLALIPEDGILVYNADDKNIAKLLPYCHSRKVSYGLTQGDYRAVDREVLFGRNQFAVEYHGQRQADLALKIFGPHNTLNALGAYAMAKELGWSQGNVLHGFANFLGVKRRQEVIGEPRGITIVEDFAHHPTAVELTIKGLREMYSGRRLFCVFEPRSATSRRNIFQKEYVNALKLSDFTLIMRAGTQDKIDPSQRMDSSRLVESINNGGGSAWGFQTVDEIVQFLKEKTEPNDVIVIMSNGGFGGIYEKLLQQLA